MGRWKKLWIEIINNLLKNKFNKKNNLFLACKKEIQDYYKKVKFSIVYKNIPEKLEC